MSSSITVAFSGKKSILQAFFLPEISLNDDAVYSCALLDLIVISEKNIKKLSDLGLIRVNCDIISGSYINGKQCHIIHQFAAGAARVKGNTFSEYAKHLNYFPINSKHLQSIQISFVNPKGELINFYDSDISCRIIIKRD